MSGDVLERNRSLCWERGTCPIGKAGHPSLAIVGGGHSAAHFPKDWDGDIWAVNRTWRWLTDMGMDAWFYTADPQAAAAPFAKGASKGILASYCDPSVFDEIVYVEAFDIPTKGYGATSAACAPTPALLKGYTEISFFGCESCFHGTTHIYADDPVPHLMKVEVGGQEFLTKPGLAMQAEMLSEFIRAAPHVFKDRSGGFLGALVEHGEYEVIAGSRQLAELLECRPHCN